MLGGVLLLVLISGSALAWAATKGPKAGAFYASRSPDLWVDVGKPATYVTVYIGCDVTSDVSEYWNSGTKISLRHDAFSFDRKTAVGTESGAGFGQKNEKVLFTGHFTGGKFVGTVHLGGSTCPESSYTAKYDARGGGGSGR